MMWPMPEGRIVTERLVLRQWRDADREPFAAMGADPIVMEHFVGPLDRAASDALIGREMAAIEARGWGLWAVERREDGRFLGFTGLGVLDLDTGTGPVTEIGWRLRADAWGHGYATEAARAALRYGFDTLGADEIVAVTAPANVRSRRVMERLGMTHDPADDFDHPRVPAGHRLQRHVLYRLPRATWRDPPQQGDPT